MFQCVYYEIDTKIIDQIIKIVNSYKGADNSYYSHTQQGFQTTNIVNMFSHDLLKKIVPINELHKKIFHIHYIQYNRGGHQTEHLHEPDDYSFILYLNDSDGDTVIKHPINKKFTPKKGKIVLFNGKILHYAEPSFKNKKILVGAIK